MAEARAAFRTTSPQWRQQTSQTCRQIMCLTTEALKRAIVALEVYVPLPAQCAAAQIPCPRRRGLAGELRAGRLLCLLR